MEVVIVILVAAFLSLIVFIRREVKREKEEKIRQDSLLLKELKASPKARLLIKTKNLIYTESFEAKIDSLCNMKWLINAGFLASKRREQIISQQGHFISTNGKLVRVSDIVDLEVVIDKP